MDFAKVFAALLFSAAIAFPKTKDEVHPPPAAPLPDRILQAKTVYLTSEAEQVVYDEAYKRLREWGRFQLTGNPENADLVLILRTEYAWRNPGLRDVFIWYPRPPYEKAETLIFADPKTKLELWTERQVERAAIKPKNQQKESILAVDALFERLRTRIPAK